ncbi:MAG: beta-galactosidase, partial [Candidatus Hydrogenedentes bacterium]|nr:beta-galactosidase [Candidatus Hydrogenedentota bacterium]
MDGIKTIVVEEETDPQAASEWAFRFKEDCFRGWGTFFIDIEFFDEGVGVIRPRLLRYDAFLGEWADPVRAVSFTRLNTRQVRHAVFEFRVPEMDWRKTEHTHLKIAGLQYVRRMHAFRLVSPKRWKKLQDLVPVDVVPAVRLQRPMRINCTVGIADTGNPPPLEQSLDNLREYAPLAKALGFTSVECFVRWDMIEPRRNRFDFSHYDRIVEALRRYDLKWFPNLVITSAFALPSWYFESGEYAPFRCLEHGEMNQSPNIWNPVNREHVSRVLHAFGAHYGPMGVLEAVRLGPSGNFGEAQYPAGAGSTLGYRGERMHAHIGWWAGGAQAQRDFQRFIFKRYGSIAALNAAWDEHFSSFDEAAPRLPETFRTRRARLDMTEWYTASMAEWCDSWTKTAREAMPDVMIYQSAGGWGYRESGTDFSAIAESMKSVGGGIRLTNETDSFEQNFYATRLAASAARLYGIALGYEPAGSHSARGVTGRIYSTLTTNGDNLYTRHGVLFTDSVAVNQWLRDYPLLDLRANPLVDVAIYYPETMSQLDDGAFRYLYGWGFNPRAAEIRRRIDADFLDERLIRVGFLGRYKVLVFCWGNIVETDVQQVMDRWIRAGGIAVYPARNNQETVDGDTTLFQAWERGDTGKGKFCRFRGDMEPISLYGDFIGNVLHQAPGLHRWTKAALETHHPERVFISILEDGTLVALNYNDKPAHIELPGQIAATLGPAA